MLLQEEYDAVITCIDLCDHYPHPYWGFVELTNKNMHELVKQVCEKIGFGYDCAWDNKIILDRDFPLRPGELDQRMKAIQERHNDTDLVFMPRRDDFHEDHSLVAKEVLKQFKSCTIFEYEIKEFRRSPFRPNLVVDVTRHSNRELKWNGDEICSTGSVSFAEKKARILSQVFPKILGIQEESARNLRALSKQDILARLRVRAAEFGLDGTYAEAFVTDVAVG